MSKKRFIPGDDEPSSYINFYIANSAIILPFFGDDVADQNAMKIIKEQFPNRQIECLDGHDILKNGIRRIITIYGVEELELRAIVKLK